MKIGIEAQRIFKRRKHGIEIVALETIRKLQELDQSNEYVIFVKDGEDDTCLLETENFRIVKVPGFTYPDWEQLQLPMAAKKEKLDLLHSTGNTAPLFHAFPQVLTLHDILYLEQLNFRGSTYQNFGNLYRRLVVPRIIDSCVYIITVSHYEKEVILNHFNLDAHKVKVVYNAINSAFRLISNPDQLEFIRTKYKLPGSFILHFGNTAPHKNTAAVLKAYHQYFKEVKNAIPLVIADCSQELVRKLTKGEHLKDIKNHLILLDHIPSQDLPGIYNLATIFLHPSQRESFAMPIIEAMACGTPVITSNTAAMPEISGGAAVLVSPQDYGEVSAAMINLLNNEIEYKKYIRLGLKRASIFSSWETSARQVLEIYNSTAKA